jgi:hypothetical protein
MEAVLRIESQGLNPRDSIPVDKNGFIVDSMRK